METLLIRKAEWLEDPSLRSALDRRRRSERRRGREDGRKWCNWVAPRGSLEETRRFFEQVTRKCGQRCGKLIA